MKRENIIHNIIQALIITAFSFLLAITSLHKILDLLDFTNSIGGGDFQISDVYNNVAENRSVRTLNNDIVIVPIDGCGRHEIADILISIESMNPAVVGMDVMFIEELEGDEYLINSINSCSNIVLPLALDNESGDCIGAYFCNNLEDANYGVVNLCVSSNNESVRTYQRTYDLNDSLVSSFAFEIASKAHRKIGSPKNDKEIISYPSIEFRVIDPQELMCAPEKFKSDIENKIILLGDIYNTGDYHLTPISRGTPGIMIHAHIIDTIISEKQIRPIPSWSSWVIAILTCFVFMCIKLFVRDISYKLGLLVMRVVQVLFLYLYFIVGCKLFLEHMLYMDFAPVFLMIALAIFSHDIWIGSIALITMIFKKKSV